MHVLWGAAGMLGLLVIAWLLSTDRSAIRLRTVVPALALQVAFGALVLYVPWGRDALAWLSRGVQAVIDSSKAGIEFLFGPLLPDEGIVFAFQVLPVIVFFAALTSVLYHLGILQRVVTVLGRGISALLGTRTAESVNAAANIFLGQTEAPLVIRPYIPRLSRSGLFAVMVGGLSTVAGSVLVGYSLLGARLEYLIAASFMAAPGALLMAKIIVPEARTEGAAADDAPGPTRHTADGAGEDGTDDDATDEDGTGADDGTGPMTYRNVIDAAASGAADGLKLALNIGAMLLAFISLIALVNLILATMGGWVGLSDLTFEKLLGWVMSPVMLLVGVPWEEAVTAGSYVGQKVVVNEFVAFTNFAPHADQLSPHTQAIVTFALTGFANLGSLGILLGGLGGLAPSRRGDIAALGIRAVLAATLANLMSAAIAGLMLLTPAVADCRRLIPRGSRLHPGDQGPAHDHGVGARGHRPEQPAGADHRAGGPGRRPAPVGRPGQGPGGHLEPVAGQGRARPSHRHGRAHRRPRGARRARHRGGRRRDPRRGRERARQGQEGRR